MNRKNETFILKSEAVRSSTIHNKRKCNP